MKILMVGTGSIGAKERSACTLINDELLIDLGNGNVKTIKQYGNDISKINTVFITHLHGDHYADIPFLIADREILQYTGRLDTDLIIYGPEALEEKTRCVCEAFFGKYEKKKKLTRTSFKKVEEGKTEKINGYEITPYLVDHYDVKPAYGYVVKKDGKSVGFSGDSLYCEAIDEIIKNSDISVLDMSSQKPTPSHMNMEDIIKLCNKYPEKKMIATHMHAEIRKPANDLKIPNLIIPNDGYVLEF